MPNHSPYKVEQVAQRYRLDSIGDELVEKWTREADAVSLRKLATYFNEHVLRAAMREARMNPLEGEVENMYRLLMDEEVSSGVKTETRKRLEQNGLDVDQVESDFITYQAVRSYLKKVRNADYKSPTDEERIETVNENITQLQGRTMDVTEEKLEQLRDTQRVTVGKFRVLLELRIFCEECGNQYDVSELLERGGCDCDESTS